MSKFFGYLVTGLLLFFLFIYYYKCYQKSLLTNWPIVGMLPAVLNNAYQVHEFIFGLLNLSGGTFEFKGPIFGNLDYTITSDPMNIHHIFSKNFANYPKGSEFQSIFEPLGDGIFNSDSDLWKTQRKQIHTLLNGKFQGFLEKVIHQKVGKSLLPILEHVSNMQSVVDMQDVFQRLSYDTICLLALGSDPGSLSRDFPTVSSQKAFDDIWEAIATRHLLPGNLWRMLKWLQLGTEKKLTAAVKALDEYLYNCIANKKAELREGMRLEQGNFDMLTAYLQNENETMQSDKQLRDDALNLMVAGRDTISSALTWFFWALVGNPQAETKILEEIRANMKGKEGFRFFTTEEVRNLVYLHGALCETLRLYPPVHMERKSPIEPDILPTGHHVDKNANILFSFYAMGRMEEIWGKDCMEFKPERWISETGKILHVPSYKFTAFNAGPRACLGRDVAFTQMRITAAAIIWNYHFQVVDDHPVQPSLSVLLQMKHGLKVRVIKREMCM